VIENPDNPKKREPFESPAKKPQPPRAPRVFGRTEKDRLLVMVARGDGILHASSALGFQYNAASKAMAKDPEFRAAVDYALKARREVVQELQESMGIKGLMAARKILDSPKPSATFVIFVLQNKYPELFQDRRNLVHEFKTAEQSIRDLEEMTGKTRDELYRLARGEGEETKH